MRFSNSNLFLVHIRVIAVDSDLKVVKGQNVIFWDIDVCNSIKFELLCRL